MLDYGEILKFLAKNPPQIHEEREVHASLLELMAQCLRTAEQDGTSSCPPQLEHAKQQVQIKRKAA